MEIRRAERQADFLLDAAARECDELRAAAADVDEQAALVAEGVRCADEVERGFFVARNDADRKACAALDFSDGLAAVLRVAQRGRRESGDARDVEAVQEGDKLFENLDGLVDALLRHDAVLDVGRKADDVLLFEQHVDVAAMDVVDGHADRARADVDDSMKHKLSPSLSHPRKIRRTISHVLQGTPPAAHAARPPSGGGLQKRLALTLKRTL